MELLNRLFHRQSQQNDHMLAQIQNKRNHNVFKNRLFLISLINLFIFMVFVFSMVYYDWARLTITPFGQQQMNCQVNLLYVRVQGQGYYTYNTAIEQMCSSADIYCISILQQLMLVGYLSFSVLAVGAGLQVFDIVKMVVYFRGGQGIAHDEKKDNLRHLITIGLFIVGITLNMFGITICDATLTFGPSFYLFLAALIAFIALIVYQHLSLSRLRKQSLILQLIKAQMKATQRHELQQQKNEVEMANRNQQYL